MAEQAHDQSNSGYETTDARVTPLAQTGLFITALVIASFIGMIVLFRALRLLPTSALTIQFRHSSKTALPATRRGYRWIRQSKSSSWPKVKLSFSTPMAGLTSK